MTLGGPVHLVQADERRRKRGERRSEVAAEVLGELHETSRLCEGGDATTRRTRPRRSAAISRSSSVLAVADLASASKFLRAIACADFSRARSFSSAMKRPFLVTASRRSGHRRDASFRADIYGIAISASRYGFIARATILPIGRSTARDGSMPTI